MEFRIQPRWDVSAAEAIAIQRELAARVRLEDRIGEVRLAAGVDLALGTVAQHGRAAVVVWRLADGEVVEQVAVEQEIRWPYVPGLLAFREGPLVEAALRSIEADVDVVLVDGQGIAHPRGLGIAAHLGVLLDRPTLGVGKTRLYGSAPEPGPNAGDREPLRAPGGRLIGALLRTRPGTKPVYVSPGQYLTPETAAGVAMACVRGHRLPEPLHLADRLSKRRR